MDIKDFKHPYFIVDVVSCAITMLIFSWGNPTLFNGLFCWHYVPEVFGLFFLGMFCAVFGLTLKWFLLGLSAGGVCSFLIVTVASLSYIPLTAYNLKVSVIYLAVLLSPLAIGFAVERKRNNERDFKKDK